MVIVVLTIRSSSPLYVVSLGTRSTTWSPITYKPAGEWYTMLIDCETVLTDLPEAKA